LGEEWGDIVPEQVVPQEPLHKPQVVPPETVTIFCQPVGGKEDPSKFSLSICARIYDAQNNKAATRSPLFKRLLVKFFIIPAYIFKKIINYLLLYYNPE
jgi:hypothetical protein